MAGETGGTGEVVYPPVCDGICSLGPRALSLVGGVLGRNCHGPVPFNTDSVFKVVEGLNGENIAVPPTAEDLDGKVCTNPRLVAAVRNLVHKEIDDLVITSVKMGE